MSGTSTSNSISVAAGTSASYTISTDQHRQATDRQRTGTDRHGPASTLGGIFVAWVAGLAFDSLLGPKFSFIFATLAMYICRPCGWACFRFVAFLCVSGLCSSLGARGLGPEIFFSRRSSVRLGDRAWRQ